LTKGSTRVFEFGMMWTGKAPMFATPTLPQSSTVVTPARTPIWSGGQHCMPTPAVVAP
jgi:hypothetical protein